MSRGVGTHVDTHSSYCTDPSAVQSGQACGLAHLWALVILNSTGGGIYTTHLLDKAVGMEFGMLDVSHHILHIMVIAAACYGQRLMSVYGRRLAALPYHEAICHEEIYGEEIDGEETDGEETDGEETDGEETDGEEIDVGETYDGETYDGETYDGETYDGETYHEEIDGGETDVGETDGGEIDGEETDDGETDGGEIDGKEIDGEETNDGDGDRSTVATRRHLCLSQKIPCLPGKLMLNSRF
ncbi:hypothetical protein IG631_23670 [Alternaria alternata]|nr:hypothetical protein IG631_23670 [Alternaria alternata]